jgi:hypothetical protein
MCVLICLCFTTPRSYCFGRMSSTTPNDHPLPPVDFSPFEQLILVAVAVLEQAVDLVENSLKQDDELTFASTLIPGSTIGQLSF